MKNPDSESFRVFCCLTGRYREQARSHRGSRLLIQRHSNCGSSLTPSEGQGCSFKGIPIVGAALLPQRVKVAHSKAFQLWEQAYSLRGSRLLIQRHSNCGSSLAPSEGQGCSFKGIPIVGAALLPQRVKVAHSKAFQLWEQPYSHRGSRLLIQRHSNCGSEPARDEALIVGKEPTEETRPPCPPPPPSAAHG
jgi:hypothetical protein